MRRSATTAPFVGGHLCARGLSQASGVSSTVISRIERDTIAEPLLRTLRALAKGLGATLDELAG